LAVLRVAERVKEGGHAIPEDIIRRRYKRSVQNFFQLFRYLADAWSVYDNTQSNFSRLVAYGNDTGNETIVLESVWRQMQEVLQ
jgi:predicted ABC-type ATPase